MKKFLAVILTVAALVACLVFTGCKSEEIELTSSNYKTYLDVSVTLEPDKAHKDKDSGKTYYNNIIPNVEVKGASTNYNYNDVVIAFNLTGKVHTRSGEVREILDEPVLVKCNIAGNGSYATSIPTLKDFYWDSETDVKLKLSYVKGTVTPAK